MMLIKNARILTMTETGEMHGDIMIEGNRIMQVGENIAADECVQVVDASGLTVIPGMIDLYVHDDGADPAYTVQAARAGGITTHLYISEEPEGACGIESASIDDHRPIRYIDSTCHSDEALRNILSEGHLVVAAIRSPGQCERVLEAAEQTRSKPILAEIIGCSEMLERIAASGCSVIIGVHRGGHVSPWHMAAELDEMGVQVAVSSCYPSAKLKLLPVCAGLCMRDGMPHCHALRTITSNPADMLGLSDCGRIAAGCKADLAVFDGDPLLLSTSHVMTIVDGRFQRDPHKQLTH